MSGSRFQDVYASSSQPDGVVTPQSWDAIFQDIDLRLLASEEQAPRIAALIETTQQIAIERLNQTLAPAIGRIQQAAEFGFLVVSSQSEATLAKDAVIRFRLAEGPQRELFQPSAFVNITRLSTADDYAVGRVRAFARTQGEIEVEIVERWGAPGPFGDWQISSSAGVVASVVQMLEAARGLEALTRTLRREVGQDREATALDRVQTGRDAVATAADVRAAAASAVEAAKFDPTFYLRKSGAKLDPGGSLFKGPSAGSPSLAGRSVEMLASFRGGSQTTTGAIVFLSPAGVEPRLIMHQMRVRGFLYTPAAMIDLAVNGYLFDPTLVGATGNPSFALPAANSLGTVTPTIRWARASNGRTALILGDVGTQWSFPNISVSGLLSHNNATDAYCAGWTSELVTDLSTYTTLTTVPVIQSVAAKMNTADANKAIADAETFAAAYSLTFGGR